MSKIKNIIKAFVPPIIISSYHWIKTHGVTDDVWSGNYSNWAEVQAKCTGYNSESILEKVKNSLLKVKNGLAVYERDSVLFDEIQYSFGLLAGLQRAALENEAKLCVLDFGGRLGSSYYQNNGFLCSLKEMQWCVVEQTHFVNCGKANFEDEHLKFFNTIEECMEQNKPNVLLLSGVLQYLEKPSDWIEKFLILEIPYIILDRTSFSNSEKDILTLQKVPESIYTASYPCWFFNEIDLIKEFQKQYTLLLSFDALDASNLSGSYFKGFILKRKQC